MRIENGKFELGNENGDWGMRLGEWEKRGMRISFFLPPKMAGNGEWGLGNGDWGMDFKMGNA